MDKLLLLKPNAALGHRFKSENKLVLLTEVHIQIYVTSVFFVLCHTLTLGETNITCKGHFPQQILDLGCNAQFVQVQAEINHMVHFRCIK